nr:MAG: replication associated protein [Cressdnaviricota sp.]
MLQSLDEFSNDPNNLIDDESESVDEDETAITAGGHWSPGCSGNTVTEQPVKEDDSARAKNWCLTWNNPRIDGEVFEDCDLPDMVDTDGIKYMTWQCEIGEKDFTPHWQIYVEYEKRVRFGVIKKAFPKCHIERRKGTQAQARDYCRKEDTRIEGIGNGPFEWGEFKADNRGERTDIIEALETLQDSKSMKQVAAKHGPAYVKFNRGFEKYQGIRKLYEVRRHRTELFILWGTPNSGKTWDAQHYKGEDHTFTLEAPNSEKGSVWWDGYEGEEVVVIDEFDKHSFLPLGELLKLADNAPKRVQIKGGSVPFLAKRIYICANEAKETWWKGQIITPAMMEALDTRITEEIQYTKAYVGSTRPTKIVRVKD